MVKISVRNECFGPWGLTRRGERESTDVSGLLWCGRQSLLKAERSQRERETALNSACGSGYHTRHHHHCHHDYRYHHHYHPLPFSSFICSCWKQNTDKNLYYLPTDPTHHPYLSLVGDC